MQGMPQYQDVKPSHIRQCRTKIVTTLGPASNTYEVLRKFYESGVDVFRMNFSHGTHDEHRATYNIIRKLESDLGRPIAVLGDLQGPKLRVGKFAEGKVTLTKGQDFRLDSDPTPGDVNRVQFPHPEIFEVMKVGTRFLLDDGKLRMTVKEHGPSYALAVVEVAGVLSDKKGVNLPNLIYPSSPLTPKDRKDLQLCLELGLDYIGLSFVQRPDDIREAREIIGEHQVGICAKIEKPSAVELLDEIVPLCDAVMVARGDMGVEMPVELVPQIQKRIVRTCRIMGKPVIVATQMLESMITAPTPTRAECSDVATAVYDGADAVMLSAESAAGKYPIEAVQMMDQIVFATENDPYCKRSWELLQLESKNDEDAITFAARTLAVNANAAAVVTFTKSGATTLRMSRTRPPMPILSMTQNVRCARRMQLAWGVHSMPAVANKPSFHEKITQACYSAVSEGICEIGKGQRVVVTAGTQGGGRQSNTICVASVDDEPEAVAASKK